jgi:hypothetical protein
MMDSLCKRAKRTIISMLSRVTAPVGLRVDDYSHRVDATLQAGYSFEDLLVQLPAIRIR